MLPLVLLLAACPPKPDDSSDSPPDTGPETGTEDMACDEAMARLGYQVCVHRVPDEPTFEAITIASSSATEPRAGKYLVAATSDARLPTLFMDANAFTLHLDFLVAAFPDLFSGLTPTEYYSMTLYPEGREYYAGTFSLYLGEDGFYYGFTVWDDPNDTSSTVTLQDVTAVWEDLQGRFDIGPLSFVPGTQAQLEAASSWDAPFPIVGVDSDLTYEVYNPGEGYGTLRLYTLEELEEATAEAAYGYQDILVLEEAPTDLERVVSGIVTGTRQGALSHIAVRSSSRGTPNCFVQGALEELAAWEGQLVRFECGESTWSVEAATVDAAAAWWDALRPEPVEICAPDLTQSTFPNLLEVPVSTALERSTATCQYGAKGTNLATLYGIVDPQYQISGFLIPFRYYDDFIHTATWTVDLGAGPEEHTFAETMDAWFTDETFLNDAAVRREGLDALREAMEDATVDPALIEALAPVIRDVWGDDTTMVRFRSSSNAEDAAEFSGAGLYDSESGCLADDLDDDDLGPCACDPDEDDERGVGRALTQVWASLWNMAAWEEQSWYGIDPSRVAMGVLADTRAKDELANIVAFSGNPTSDDDDRYLVNAQVGELDVVSADPGVYPESELLTLEGGTVTDILRVSTSSETSSPILSDAQLEELGAVLYGVAQVYPYDGEVPEGKDLLWDTEWKVWSDGRLIVKQIRPYLR